MIGGRCMNKCGPNQVFRNRLCGCQTGYKVQGKDCVRIKDCPTGRVWDETEQACVCAPGFYISGKDCLACPKESDSTSDRKSCVCREPHQYYDGFKNLCKNRCGSN